MAPHELLKHRCVFEHKGWIMTNPESLRKRIKSFYVSRRIDTQPPSIVGCIAAIEIIALALNTTTDELSRRIELSPMTVPYKPHDHRQMDLFHYGEA